MTSKPKGRFPGAGLIGGPAEFRRRLQDLGPVFIKIGQFLALRPDILPQAYCDELLGLADDVEVFPWEQAEETLARELGADFRQRFDYINPEPLAAGSLAQTHEATVGGTRVIVKILRPDIEARVDRDLRKLRLLANLVELAGGSLIVSPRRAADEIAGWLRQEIDLRRELRNLSQLSRLAQGSRFQKIPRPFPELSAARVVTMELLEGTRLSTLLEADRVGAPAMPANMPGVLDRARFAENLIKSCLTQMFDYRFFHADLHPGNLFVLPGGRVGFVDFGLCDRLDDAIHRGQTRYLSAVYSGDPDRMFDALADILVPQENHDRDRFRADFMAEAMAWKSREEVDGLAGDDTDPAARQSPIARFLVGVMRVAQRHHLQVPARALAMYRAILTAETISVRIARDVDLRTVGRQFFAGLRLRQALAVFDSDKIEPSLMSALTLLRDAPGQIQDLLEAVSRGRFELKVDVAEGAKTRRLRNRRLRLLVTSVLTVGLSLTFVAPVLPVVLGVSLRTVVGIALLVSYCAIAVQWIRLR